MAVSYAVSYKKALENADRQRYEEKKISARKPVSVRPPSPRWAKAAMSLQKCLLRYVQRWIVEWMILWRLCLMKVRKNRKKIM